MSGMPADPMEKPATDPAKGFSIAALVLAFLFPIAGLIMGIVGAKKSRAAGFDGRFGTIAIVVSVAMMAFALITRLS